MTDLPAVPDGYTLDEPQPADAQPAPPAGYSVDAPNEPGLLGAARSIASGFAQNLSAGMQGTSPIVTGLNGQPNYQRLGNLFQSDAGPAYVDSAGQWQLVNPQTDVVLNDPQTKLPTVFARSPETNEGAASIGRLLGFGASAPTAVAAPALVAPAAKAAIGIFASPENKALGKIGAAVGADRAASGPSAADIIDRLKTANNPLMTPIDVAGENVRALAGQAARVPGPGRQAITTALNDRDAGAGQRLADAVSNMAQPGDSNFLVADALQRQARDTAQPLYEKAFAPGSMAPLEQQFASAVADAGKEKFAASAALAAAQRQATQAAARQTLAGDNVYLNNSGNAAMKGANDAINAAQQRLASANDAYDSILTRLRDAQAAAAAGQRGGVWSPRLQQFLDDPISQSGLRQGLEIQRLESLADGKQFNPSDYAITGTTPSGEPAVGAVPNMRTLDAVKRGLDNMLEGYRDSTTGRLMLDQRGRAIDQVRRAFLDEVDSLNPDYAAARAAYSGPQQSRGALLQGAGALNRDPDEIASDLSRLSPGDQQFYRLGAANALKAQLAKTSSGGNEARAITGNQYRQTQLRSIFPQADSLIDAAKTENTMFGTRNAILGNSATAARLAQDTSEGPGLWQPLGEALVAGATHEPMVAAKAGVSFLKNLSQLGSRMTPEVANHIAGYLLQNDPSQWLLQALQRGVNPTLQRPMLPYAGQAIGLLGEAPRQ